MTNLPNKKNASAIPHDPSVFTPPLDPDCTSNADCPCRGLSVTCHGLTADEQEQTLTVSKLFVIYGAASIGASWSDLNGRRNQVHLEGNSIWILAEDTPYTVAFPEHVPVVTILFDESFLEEVLGRDFVLPTSTQEALVGLGARDHLIQQLSEAFRPLCQPSEKISRRYVECLARVLATRVLIAEFGPIWPPVRTGGLPATVLHKVCADIWSHLDKGYQAARSARLAGYSPGHFARLFKESMHLTPQRFVLECRLYRARELLETTDLPLTDVAASIGFTDQSAFNKRFKTFFKITPTEVRAKAVEKTKSAKGFPVATKTNQISSDIVGA